MYAAIILASILGPLALMVGLARKDRRRRESQGAYLSHPKGGLSMGADNTLPLIAYLSDARLPLPRVKR